MKTLVRLILLAGCAAALSLALRDDLTHRVLRAVDAPTRLLSGAVAELQIARRRVPPTVAAPPLAEPPVPARAPEMMPVLSGATTHEAAAPPMVPLLPKAAAKTAGQASASSSGSATTITRAELESAIATRLSGAQVSVVRDEAGHPLGLALHGVGMLARFGIHDGDVLLRANGLPLRTGDEALAALGALQDAHHVTVAFRRGNAPFAVSIDLEP